MSLRERAAALEGVDLLDESEVEVLPGEQIVRIPKTEIYSTEQVRKNFNAESIEEMAFSLEEEGQIQPIVVSERDSRGYCIQKGERRWRGAKMSDKITHLDCLVRAPGSIWGQLAENIIREDLTPFEVGMAIEKGKKEHNLDNRAAAKKLGISTSKVSAYLKAITAPEVVKKAYKEGTIGDVDTINSLRIAHELNPEATEALLSNGDGVSRKQAQNLTKELKNGSKSEPTPDNEQHNPTSTPAKKDRKSKPVAKAIRVSVAGQYGVIDMKGNTDEGELMVLLDDASEAVSVSASEIELIGYHLG
ncbi:ParB/RepB/Spo0J family partition protein [Vibrio europaeus]|uniref:Chromosome partitioning protein ParB n=1 Tax=Vibrio europaeus TaxID=300876 RepID=A0A178J562_9VIBR|nr:ParB/RepB/Spo0J family partition protein [Vibrio europaeus]MDC5708422.1 ParB/RepB/Spo0J family partition protein [Vibrio europaeus]MDC5713154.1 ParB/RepB/Spo0J family partition protein [Vibrio europaeus]MDC5728145.1 ParB/RepB/Spo0J family partition protein [Vibrio europaeus]MDC5733260.1 ParB/RepB/Spo0J family partition protein [Vibrio europaeus]MDC5742362.1 ParB/RepB/Spo0J family partition protein [Vibrio europaeus]